MLWKGKLTDECRVDSDSSEDEEAHSVGDDGGEDNVYGTTNHHQNQTNLQWEKRETIFLQRPVELL